MAIFSVVPYDTGPAGPSADVERPNYSSGGSAALHPLTILLNAAGALRGGFDRMAPPVAAAPAAPQGFRFPDSVPIPGPSADVNRPPPPLPPTLTFTPAGPMGMAAPDAPPPAPPPAAPPWRPEVYGPSADVDRPVVAPPVNDDIFGRVLRGLLDANPVTAGLPTEVKDRGAAIFRLFADDAWRNNTPEGAAVSNLESGIHETPDALRRLPAGSTGPHNIMAPRSSGPIPNNYFDSQTPEGQKALAERAERKKFEYDVSQAQKRDQLRALGQLSTGEQIGSVISSLIGSLGSVTNLVGPAGTAYRTASTGSKVAQSAAINAGVVGVTDPIAQMAAVERDDKREFSPAEWALATGGAAGLGALIPALGALARRFGALREASPASTRPPEASPEQPKIDTSVKPQEAPPVEARLPNAEIIRNPEAPKPDAAVEGLRTMARESLERQGIPPKAAEPAPKPAPEAVAPEPPRAVEPAPKPAEPAAPAVPEVAPTSAKEPAKPAVSETPKLPEPGQRVRVTYQDGTTAEMTKIGETATAYRLKLDNGGEIKPLKKLVRVDTLEEAAAQKSNMLERLARKTDDPAELDRILAAAKGDVHESRIAWAVANNPHAEAATFAEAKAVASRMGSVDSIDARRAELRAQRGLDEPTPPPKPVDKVDAPRESAGMQPREVQGEILAPGKQSKKIEQGFDDFEITDAQMRNVDKAKMQATKRRIKDKREYDAGEREGFARAAREEQNPTIPHVSEDADGNLVVKIPRRPDAALPAPTRAASQPPDIPDFLRRPMPEKEAPAPEAPRAPEPVEGPKVEPAPKTVEAPRAEPPVAPEKVAPPDKPRVTRGLKSKPIAEQAEHHRKINPKTYRDGGPADEKGLREYFTPGRIVPSYGGKDRVLGFDWNDGAWRARVEAVDPKTGVSLHTGAERTHTTRPTWQRVAEAARDPLNAPKPTHPLSAPPDKPTEMHASLGLTPAMAKQLGPEMAGAFAGGMYDFDTNTWRPSWQGAFVGALAVAALRRRIPGIGKAVLGKGSLATDALSGAGDILGKTWGLRNFHPTHGAPKGVHDAIIRARVETRNLQDDALKMGRYIRQNFTMDERIAISDYIEMNDLSRHGSDAWLAADKRVRDAADILKDHVDAIGEQLVKHGGLDKQAFESLRGEYLHRYYMAKQAKDPGFRQAAKRMQATATYSMRRGQEAEAKLAPNSNVKIGDTLTEWTHAKTGDRQWLKTGVDPGNDWISGRQWKVDALDGNKATLHRDYTLDERAKMGEIRDANYRFVMGTMEASRDVGLFKLFSTIQANPEWASRVEKAGWVRVPLNKVGDSEVRKFGNLAGYWVPPEVMSALRTTRKPWTSEEWGLMGRMIKGYLKMLQAWKVGKTAYNPATHFNNVMGNVGLSMLTGEVTPLTFMKAAGALKRGDAIVEEARRAGLSLNREAMLGDELRNVQVDVGLATGADPQTLWQRAMAWYLDGPVTKLYQSEDSIFKLAAYMGHRQQGKTPEQAVEAAHRVFFDYSDVPLGVQALRDSYAPFFTYTYKFGQLALREAAERPWRAATAFGALTAMNTMAYGWLFGQRGPDAEKLERELLPKWSKGATGVGSPRMQRLPWNEPDTVTGQPRSQFLNMRYMMPGGDILDFVANGKFGPEIWPQALGNTLLGGNPFVNFGLGMAQGRDTFFDKPLVPYKDTGLTDAMGSLAASVAEIMPGLKPFMEMAETRATLEKALNNRPAREVAANFGAYVRFAAMQALPPILTTVPDKLGQAATGDGLIDKDGGFAQFMGWTGTDYAGRQRTVAKALLSAMGIKIEDMSVDEQMGFRQAEALKGVREAVTDTRRAYMNQGKTEPQRAGQMERAMDRAQRATQDMQKLQDLRTKAGQ